MKIVTQNVAPPTRETCILFGVVLLASALVDHHAPRVNVTVCETLAPEH